MNKPLTADEAASFLRIHRQTVYQLALRGELPGRKVGNRWRFDEEQLREYVRHGEQAGRG